MTSVSAELTSARLFTESNTVLPHALYARECGYSIIPLKGGPNRASGKQPRIKWQTYQSEHASSDQIERWFRGGTSAYGIVCGQISQLIVIDFDEPDAQAKFMQKFPHLMNTYIVQSGGRGTLHLYFEVDFPVRTTKIQGGDLKAEGSYVVGAGSTIAGGTWKLSRDVPLKRISRKDLNDVMSVFSIVRRPRLQPVIKNIPNNT
ncbi:MAG: bifunctional DNA primase/polymerase, partial [Aggregatilineales bacterium]